MFDAAEAAKKAEEAKRAEDEKRKKAVQQATLPSPSQAVQNLKTQWEQDLNNTEEEYNKAMDALRHAKNKREAGEWEQKTDVLWKKITELRRKLGYRSRGDYPSKIEPKNDDDPMALLGKEISKLCVKGGTLQQNDTSKWLCQWGQDQGPSKRPLLEPTDIDPNNPSPHAPQ